MRMEKGYFPVLVLLAITFSTLACGVTVNEIGFDAVRGSGTVTTEERPVSGFDSVDLSGIGTLYIEIGGEEALVIEAEENLLEYLETEVRGNTLSIGVRERTNLQPTEPIDYYLTVPSLDSVSVSGLGNISAPAFEVSAFTVNISGSGDVDLEVLEADRLNVHISGLGSLGIDEGSVSKQDITISGNGSYNARYLESTDAKVTVSGLGSATVWATDNLYVSISGSGSVSYAGDPEVDMDISGKSSLKKIDD